MPRPKKAERSVLYPEVTVGTSWGESALTVEQAKKILEWQEEGEEEDFGTEYLLVDKEGKKIRCNANMRNRPLYMNVVETISQEILRRRWKFNGEPIIVGKTGIVLNGQHTLIGLILAEQERVGENKHHWAEYWKGPVSIEKAIVFGVDETDDVVNTMDTCRPRSLADVIYRSEYFAKKNTGVRKIASRATDYAIRFLWHRTGVSLDAFAPRRTHAEFLDFLARHPRILKAVNHILEEDSGGRKISSLLSPGYAAGLLYLQACSTSDVDVYRNADPPNEKKLKWDLWDKATEFWVLLAGDSPIFEAVRGEIARAITGGVSKREATIAVLCKAWAVFVEEGKPSKDDLKLKWVSSTKGTVLSKTPSVGGIDLGDPEEHEEPSQEEIKAAAAAEKKRKLDKKSSNGKAPPKPRKKKEEVVAPVEEEEVPDAPMEEEEDEEVDDIEDEEDVEEEEEVEEEVES